MRQTLRRNVRQALASEPQAVNEALDRAETVLALPWHTREPQRFDPEHLKQALDRPHGGLEPVKTRLIEVLAACPQTCGLLTVETPRRGRTVETDPPPALAVRPGPSEAPGSVLCLVGQPGTGKRSLAIAVAVTDRAADHATNQGAAPDTAPRRARPFGRRLLFVPGCDGGTTAGPARR